MSINSMMTDEVTIITPAYTTDNRNNQAKDWASATSVVKKGWMAQTNASAPNTELTPNREGTLTEWRLFLPLGTVLDNKCRVSYGGDTYEVVGAIHIAKTNTGNHHLEVPLRLVVG